MCESSGCGAYLTPGGDKHQDRLQHGVGLYGCIGWLVHGGHAGAVELARVALNMTFQGHRAHTWLEVEQPLHITHPHIMIKRCGFTTDFVKYYHPDI